jgi:hypothetical protein
MREPVGLRAVAIGTRLAASRRFSRRSLERIDRLRFDFGGGLMARIWNTPVFILAMVYFVVDVVSSYVTQPITVWLAKKRLFERVRLWVISLGPYPSLALFAVPVIILEPAKPLSAYLIGTGHFFAGAVTFITAEVLKLTFVERLFQLNREKLLSIPAFAWGYQYWRHIMDVIESMEAWKAARRLAADAARMVRTRWSQFKRARRLSRLPYHS